MQHRKAVRGHGSVKKERKMGEEMRGYPMRRERKSKNRRKSKSRSERAVTYSEDRRKKQRLCYHWDPFPGP